MHQPRGMHWSHLPGSLWPRPAKLEPCRGNLLLLLAWGYGASFLGGLLKLRGWKRLCCMTLGRGLFFPCNHHYCSCEEPSPPQGQILICFSQMNSAGSLRLQPHYKGRQIPGVWQLASVSPETFVEWS